MSEERLIIPKRPQHHTYRFVAAVALCGLAVAGVWGWQMKSTFDRYASERAAQGANDEARNALERDRLNLNDDAAAIKDSVDEVQGLIEQVAREELAKQQALEAVKEEMSDTVVEQGEVAGETTEVPAN